MLSGGSGPPPPASSAEGAVKGPMIVAAKVRGPRNGQKYRGPIDVGISWNVDTISSEAPDPNTVPLPPGLLVERLRHARELRASVAMLQAHRWSFTGKLHGTIEGFQVWVAGATQQGSPEGVLMCCDVEDFLLCESDHTGSREDAVLAVYQ